MGFQLSSIANLPYNEKNEFYIYVLGGNANWQGGILETVSKNFKLLAKEIGPNAIIAEGLNPKEWTYEIAAKYFGANANLEKFFPGFLITNSHPDKFDKNSMRILISLKQVQEHYKNIEHFFNLLTDFVTHKNKDFLNYIENNINWIKELNSAVDLKPKMMGIGINFNSMITLATEKKDKPIIENGK